jgi:lactose/cellobiose-specific phosphotransferase system IIC component
MEVFIKVMQEFDIFISKLANQQMVRVLRRGLLYLMPFVLIGSIVLALLNLPIPAYQSFMSYIFGEGWREIGLLIYEGTLQIMAIITLITVSHAVASEKELIKSGEVSTTVLQAVALIVFIIWMKTSDGIVISTANAGSSGMFGAIIISFLACGLYCFFHKIQDCIRPKNLISYHGSPMTREAFRTVVPALLTVFTFSMGKVMLDLIGFGNYQFLHKIHDMWLSGQNFYSAVIIILITHILWFFGIHGGNVIMDAMPVAASSVSSAMDAVIFNKEFFDTYVYLGGAGATFGLLIALLLVGKNSSETRLAKISVLPGIFNINEVMIFGLPIIFNPYFFAPFVLAPVFLCLNAWIYVSVGWVPPVTQAVKWTTPIFLSGYLSTGSVVGAVMQAVNLVLAVLIYIPFIRLQEKHQQCARIEVFKGLADEIQYIQERQTKTILNRHDETGSLARALAEEIREGFKSQAQTLHMEYQPKVNYKGQVVGAEALLRWNHPVFGYVSPIVILNICDEANLTNELGQWIMNRSFSDMKCWHEQGFKVPLSVNLSPRQLKEDGSLVRSVQDCINQLGIEPQYMELELTENATIDATDAICNKLGQITAMGLNLSIDDFGMGHSSLLYICDFYANVIKLDASLVGLVTSDEQRRQIIKSILTLCEQLHVKAVAEGVETREQVEMLHELGCECYQGFYYSRSLNYHSFLEYISRHGTAEEEKQKVKAGEC